MTGDLTGDTLGEDEAAFTIEQTVFSGSVEMRGRAEEEDGVESTKTDDPSVVLLFLAGCSTFSLPSALRVRLRRGGVYSWIGEDVDPRASLSTHLSLSE